jgi:hypothetical protein
MGITAGTEYGVLGDSYVAANKTITTSQSLLAAGSVNLSNRETIIIFNKGTANIFIGPTGVTINNGLKIVPNQMMTLNAGEQIQIYAITDTGSASVVVQELA